MFGKYSGWHLALDGVVPLGIPTDRLGDQSFLDEAIRQLVEVLDMEILMEPTFKVVDLNATNLDSPSDDGGTSGFCMVTTSHISIHTWPLRSRFALDVFSCKRFDRDTCLEFLVNKLQLSSYRHHWIEREWPDEVAQQSEPSLSV
eukprot:gnl/Trimastix_PCT/147.p2 GENE.gnl/Trimastix_PCT/147~~gnl/Trimastix_PCT/147.p2  ORF type:complete len:145 (+),score=9.24 gnl/Trimastix_PCT/147:69-503(+)